MLDHDIKQITEVVNNTFHSTYNYIHHAACIFLRHRFCVLKEPRGSQSLQKSVRIVYIDSYRDDNETLHNETETLMPRDETRLRRSKKRLDRDGHETETFEIN
jgi:hypothetical protein